MFVLAVRTSLYITPWASHNRTDSVAEVALVPIVDDIPEFSDTLRSQHSHFNKTSEGQFGDEMVISPLKNVSRHVKKSRTGNNDSERCLTGGLPCANRGSRCRTEGHNPHHHSHNCRQQLRIRAYTR